LTPGEVLSRRRRGSRHWTICDARRTCRWRRVDISSPVPYSQHFILFVTISWARLANCDEFYFTFIIGIQN